MRDIESFWDLVSRFVSGNSYYIFALLGIILILQSAKKKDKIVIFGTVLIWVICIFNPLSYKIIGNSLGQSATYYRFLWIIPYNILFAYAVFECIKKVSSKKIRLLVTVVFCFGIIFTNITKEELVPPNNVYQISNETLAVAERLKELRIESNADTITILSDFEICNNIRQYDAKICLPFETFGFSDIEDNLDENTSYGLMSMLVYNHNNLSVNSIREIIDINGIDYIIVKCESTVFSEYMEEVGYVIIDNVAGYNIIKCNET